MLDPGSCSLSHGLASATMAAEAFALGDRCFVEEDYDGAVEHYGQASRLAAPLARRPRRPPPADQRD